MMDLTLTPVGRTSPTYRRHLERAAAMLEEALNDPEVLEKLSQAEEANAKVEASTPGDEGTVEDGERLADEVIACYRAASDLVRLRYPEVYQVFGENGVLNLLLRRFAEDDSELPVIRFAGVPGYEERPLWVLLNAKDIEAMQRELRTGQVWVNASELDHDRYLELWGLVSYQRQRLGKVLKAPGRRAGSASPARLELAREIKGEPGLTYADIYARGVERGVWPDGGSYYATARGSTRRCWAVSCRATLIRSPAIRSYWTAIPTSATIRWVSWILLASTSS